MSDEEKKAIEFFEKLKEFKVVLSCSYWNNGEFEFNNTQKEQFDIILNLIEKQSKEIEELKEKDDANLAYYDQIYQNGIYTGQKAVVDKIKAKIEEVKDGTFDAEIVLQSLLEKE